MKRLFCLGLIVVLLLSSLPSIFALPNSNAVANNKIPDHAVEITEGVFSLGTAKVDGKFVQGFLFVRYHKNFVKPDWVADKTDKTDPEETPYAFLSKGAKWKTIEDYVYDDDINLAFVAAIETSFGTWESAADNEIFGSYSKNAVDGIETDNPDGVNEIVFGDISEPKVIAMCIVWGVFLGPPSSRQLVEFDLIFDDVDFNWGYAGDTSEHSLGDQTIMDVQNIATHEIGHALGLADLYTSTAPTTEQTMYGYAQEGETKKRTLEAGDIAGVNALYG